MNPVPVIAIDGPSASGKGTVAERVAAIFGFNYLDSGAIYRAAALAVVRAEGRPERRSASIAGVAGAMPLRFGAGKVWLREIDVSEQIRGEACGADASRIAAVPEVRAALLERQRAFRVAPGLVADGRDMASVVFPDAMLKVFLTASVEERAWRRTAQLAKLPLRDAKGLIEKKKMVNCTSFLAPFWRICRNVIGEMPGVRSPLKQAEGAKLLDTTQLSVDEAVALVSGWYRGLAAPG